MDKIKVLIVTNQYLIGEGLKKLLESNIQTTAFEIRSMNSKASYDIDCFDLIIVLVNKPDENNLICMQKFLSNKGNAKVLLLSIFRECEFIQKVFRMGINGYATLDSDKCVLLDAILNIHNGNQFLQRDLLVMMKRYQRMYHQNKNKILSQRELEVSKLIITGMANRDIAQYLRISEATVRNHLANIYHKTGTSSRTELAIQSMKYNLQF